MRNLAALLLALTVTAAPAADVYRPPTGETEAPDTGTSSESAFRVALSVNTALAVGDWKAHPIEGDRTMFGPLVGVELETGWSLGGLFLGALGRMCTYDTGGVVGLGEGSGEIEAAHAMSLAALGEIGLYLGDGRTRPWVGLGVGVEWMIAGEEIAGVVFDFDEVFLTAVTFSPAAGLEIALSDDLFVPVRVSYDFSLNQVRGYGDYSGSGQDLVAAVGIGLRL
jgi:opacity protein-like surface antigen